MKAYSLLKCDKNIAHIYVNKLCNYFRSFVCSFLMNGSVEGRAIEVESGAEMSRVNLI